MKFIRYTSQPDGRYLVTLIHHRPDELNDSEKHNGFLVDSLPQLESKVGKTARLYVDVVTKDMWYEYEDRPLTPEEELEQLKHRQDATDGMVLQLLMEGMI